MFSTLFLAISGASSQGRKNGAQIFHARVRAGFFRGGLCVLCALKKMLPKIVKSVREEEVAMFTKFHVPHSNCICVVSSHWGRLLLWVRAPFLASRVESSSRRRRMQSLQNFLYKTSFSKLGEKQATSQGIV